jgi:hypothetical protein
MSRLARCSALFEHGALSGLAELLDDANAQQVQDARLRVRHLAACNAGADLLICRRRGALRGGCYGCQRLHCLHARTHLA